MFAMIGAVVFFGAAVFSLIVMTEMVRGYRPMIRAALRGEPMPRTLGRPVQPMRRRPVASTFTPRRLEPARAAA